MAIAAELVMASIRANVMLLKFIVNVMYVVFVWCDAKGYSLECFVDVEYKSATLARKSVVYANIDALFEFPTITYTRIW